MENFFENLLSNGELQKENERLQEELQPFKDDYFKGLDNKAIAELAKKSIRITAENRRLENCLQEIKEIVEKELSYDIVKATERQHYENYDRIRYLISKSEVE